MMKRFFLFFALSSTLVTFSFAQDSVAPKDTSWKTAGFLGITASQTSLKHWQGGGQNNISVTGILNVEAVYKKGKHTWLNKLDCQYGLINQGSINAFNTVGLKRFRKNNDQIFAMTKYNLDAWNKYWFYTAVADFRSQFSPGYTYVGDSISGQANSDFMSPAYIQLALGLDYKPTNYFSVTMAPLAGKITHVNRQYLADAGAFGVEKAVYDETTGALVSKGKKTRYEFGGRLTLKFKKDIIKNVNWDSYLDLFSNYSNNPQNIDVVFNNLITIKVHKLFTVNIISQMIYDDDIIVREDADADGINEVNGPRLQTLTTLAIGFGYKF